MSAVTNFGRPTAATSNRRGVWKARSFVCEWQMVTVAPACSSSIAIGLPTMLERPMTTASFALQIDAGFLEQLGRRHAGCLG